MTPLAPTSQPVSPYPLEPTGTQPTPLASLEITTRTQVITYTFHAGDSLSGIAQMFNLKPETIIWANPEIYDNHNVVIKLGKVLNILPVDGAYHRWKAGEDLDEVANYYGVSADVIVNWPGNYLDPLTLGAYSNPNIEPGTMLIIPGGKLPFFTDSTLPDN